MESETQRKDLYAAYVIARAIGMGSFPWNGKMYSIADFAPPSRDTPEPVFLVPADKRDWN